MNFIIIILLVVASNAVCNIIILKGNFKALGLSMLWRIPLFTLLRRQEIIKEAEKNALSKRAEDVRYLLKLGGADCFNCTVRYDVCDGNLCIHYRGDKATEQYVIDEQNKLVKDYMDFNAKWR